MSLHNLPVQLTPFVGRTRELAEIADLLANPDCRLLTLVGPGGIGKTRLATEVGTRLLDMTDFDGVYFVALQPLSSPQTIPSAVAEAAGVQFYPGGEPRAQLVEHLQSKCVLLIFDNFEHLLEAAEFISYLLANVPQLKVLATSRETLNLQEEWLYQVKGMHYPASGVSETDDSLAQYSAVRLFVQSAQRARPDFSVQGNGHAIMRLCRMVEGMPLAIEITAAWLKRLPLQEIVSQLEGGLDILETSARNVPARHRSIRAVIDQSWDLLSDDERRVFKKLSVFRGGFRREAAEAVSGASLSLLSALVDKSLLRVDDAGRYDLHELLRQYAEEQLNTRLDEAGPTRESHCLYFLNFMEERGESLVVHASHATRAEVEAEFDNILAACDWMVSHRNLLEAFATFSSFAWVLAVWRARYEWRCLFQEGETFFAKMTAALRDLAPDLALISSLVSQGLLAFLGSPDSVEAIPLIEEALALASQRKSYIWMSDCHLRLSEIMIRQGDYDRARHLALEAIEDIRQAEDGYWGVTFSVAHLGHIAYLMGDYQEAEHRLREAVILAQQHNVPIGVADALNYLGQVHLAQHAYPDAWQTYSESLVQAQHLDYPKGVVLALIGLGDTARGMRDFEQSWQSYGQAMSAALASHQAAFSLEALVGVAELFAQTGQPDDAFRLLTFAVDHPAASHETKIRAQNLLKSRFPQKGPSSDRAARGSLDDLVRTLLETGLPKKPEPSAGDTVPTADLSERELEILRLMADGLSNREIAEKLFLAVSTVKWYLSEIYSKLYVSSRTQALARARELHLIA